jgi:hypothetical protein
VAFREGALLSTTPSGFGSSFASLADDSTIHLAASKALYDTRYSCLACLAPSPNALRNTSDPPFDLKIYDPQRGYCFLQYCHPYH